MKTKKKNPQDATTRNIKATKKREAKLSRRIEVLESRFKILAKAFIDQARFVDAIWKALQPKKKGKK